MSTGLFEREEVKSEAVAAPAVAIDAQMAGRFRRLFELTWTLAVTDWKMRFYGSVLGYFWSLARPFAFFGVVYIVFTKIAHLDKDIKNYGVIILFGMVLFNFFAEVTNSCVSCLLTRENLLRKMRFPRLVIPFSVTLTGLLNLFTTLAAVFIFAIAAGVEPRLSWIFLIPLIGLLTMFASGIGMLLSVLYVRYRDIQPIWEVFTQMLFYASPILYVATKVPPDIMGYFLINPLAAILTEVRHSVIDPTASSSIAVIGGAVHSLVPLSLIFGCFGLGLWAFQREAPKIAERL